jgi:type VI secretion system secreted protein Hcp
MKHKLASIIFLTLLITIGLVAGLHASGRVEASKEFINADTGVQNLYSDELPPPLPTPAGRYFAKYEGIDGESQDAEHDKWIEILSIDWGAHRPGTGAAGPSRRRGAAIVEDITISFAYEKATPKLQEKCLKGEVIPKLEIELVGTGDSANQTYLKYELKNVMVTSFQDSGRAETGPPTVVISNNFEEIKVTYTEYDDTGSSKGNVEYEFKVEKGE